MPDYQMSPAEVDAHRRSRIAWLNRELRFCAMQVERSSTQAERDTWLAQSREYQQELLSIMFDR